MTDHDRPAGPPARLFRLATSAAGTPFVQTYNRFSRRWQLYGFHRGRHAAEIMVAIGVAAWVEPRS